MKILNSPNKFDLMIAVFDNQVIKFSTDEFASGTRSACETLWYLGNIFVSRLVDNHTWELEGYARVSTYHDSGPWRPFKAKVNTETREGSLEIDYTFEKQLNAGEVRKFPKS